MVIAVYYISFNIENINTKNLQFVITVYIVECNCVIARLTEDQITTRAIHCAHYILAQTFNACGDIILLGSPRPTASAVPRFEHKRFQVGCLAGCVISRGGFYTGKNLVAGNNCATGITHNNRRLFAIDILHSIHHRSDAVHCNASLAGVLNIHFGAQVV